MTNYRKNNPAKAIEEGAFVRTMHKIERWVVVRAIRNGLVNMIPVLIIGAFALIFMTFPITAYQSFIKNFAGGILLEIFTFANSATFGVLSVYMTVSISLAYVRLRRNKETVNFGAVITALVCFFILTGASLENFGTAMIGPKGMFSALLTSLTSTELYIRISGFFTKRQKRLFSAGADFELNTAISTLFPMAIVVLIFAMFNELIVNIFSVASCHDFFIQLFKNLFSIGKAGFFKGFFFVLLSSTLWFFGIHGSDVLEDVMQTYFAPNLAANQAAIAAGGEATHILTKPFFDCFVLMGGCGSAICLLLAILFFSRDKAKRNLGITAAFPMLFNINELMVFGLPIIFNPIMLIPFLLVPVVCYSVSYFALAAGLVPLIIGEVEWTTPIILGGYYATGSIAGSLLQIFNVIIGILIYLPFVRLLDRTSEARAKRDFNDFVDYFRANEQILQEKSLSNLDNAYSNMAKVLAEDFQHALLSNDITLWYQPQFEYSGNCMGVEALLRWNHPIHGFIYPPLIIKLAMETGNLEELEETIFRKALSDREAIYKKFGQNIKISINVTGTTIAKPEYLRFLVSLNEKEPFAGQNICLEVTEQATLDFNNRTEEIFTQIHNMGLLLAIDDFSMGQTSIRYLKDNLFDIIKLDGSLVKGLHKNENCREIIASITSLADSLSIQTLAEFVETEEEKEILHSIGCNNYQGYLYSPAISLSNNE